MTELAIIPEHLENATKDLTLRFSCPECGEQLFSKGSDMLGAKCPVCNKGIFSSCFFCLYGRVNSPEERSSCPDGCSYSSPKFVLHPKYREIELPSLEES